MYRSVLWDVCSTDHIFEQILYSSDPLLSEAQAILQNILCRRLYKYVGQTTPDSHYDMSQVRVHSAHLYSQSDTHTESDPNRQ